MSARRSRAETVKLIKLSLPWEEVDSDLLSPDEKAVFKHRKDALDMYLDGCLLSDIKFATTVGGNYLRKIIKRCLTLAPDGRPFGYSALLRNKPTKKYSRNKPLVFSAAARGAGFSGALGLVFERYPGLQNSLDSFILKTKSSKSSLEPAHKFSNRAKDAHHEFVRLLECNDHPRDEWPFTHKYRAGRTISDYVKDLRAQHFERTVRLIGGKGAVAHLAVGTGHTPTIKLTGLNDVWEMDSHKIDSDFVIGVTNSAGLTSVENIKSLHVLAAVDPSDDAAMWYRVVYGADVTAEDVIALTREALGHELPKPSAVIPNLTLNEGAGFPADIFAELRNSPPSVIRFDNALAHLAEKVCSELRKQTGCVFDYGPPGHFERRPNIENMFKDYTQALGQRMRSSTGTGPDGGGDKEPGQAAKAYMIDSSLLEHLTYVTLANHNATPNQGLGSLSPLEAIAQIIAAGDHHYLPRKIPADRQSAIGLGLVKEGRIVRGNIEDGIRPYINFESTRYTSKRLQEASNIIGQEIILEINESNIVVVHAFLTNGEPLGPLTVQGDWAETPHSRKTRKFINSLRYKGVISWVENENPLTALNVYLESEIRKKQAGGKSDRKSASELDRLRHEVARNANASVQPEENVPQQVPAFTADPEPVREWVLPAQELDLFALIKKMK
jgi:hypothetical protein